MDKSTLLKRKAYNLKKYKNKIEEAGLENIKMNKREFKPSSKNWQKLNKKNSNY